MRRRTFLLGAGAGVLASCGKFAGAPSQAGGKGSVVIGWKLDEISSLDPVDAFERSSTEICRNIYNTLLVYDTGDTSVIKGLAAQSWTADPDGRRYVFKLRPGMKFHSGRPVTSKDFLYSIVRAVELDRAPTYMLADIGINRATVSACVQTPDAATIVVELPEPRAQQLVLCTLTTNVTAIVDSEEVKAHASGSDFGNDWLKRHSAGSGPFRLTAWQPNQSVILDRYDGYWRGAAKSSRILLRHLPEPSTQQLLLQKGDIDIARNLNPSQTAAVVESPSFETQSGDTFRIDYICLNAAYAPLQKEGVLEALKYLIDYDGLVATILKGFAVTRQSFVPLGIPGAVKDAPYRLDVDRAKQLLRDAGYADGFEIAVDVRGSSPDIDIAQALQASFAKAAVRLTINSEDYKQMLTKFRARRHQMVIANWGSDYPDPHAMAGAFASNPDNSDDAVLKTVAWRASWNIPQMTRDVAAAARELDAAKRKEMYEDIQREHMKSAPIIEVFQEKQVIVKRKGVNGLLLAPSSYPDIYLNLQKT